MIQSNSFQSSSNSSTTYSEGELKGRIPYPCCPKEGMMVFKGTHGRTSGKCPNCGKFANFDFDLMSATPSHALRGASKRFKTA